MANWRDNMMNSVSSEGVTITDGEATAVSTAMTPSWEDYARASFSEEGLRVKGFPQKKIIPVANASNAGKIIQYIGETTTDYTKGYFYECILSTNPEYDTSIKAPTRLKATVDTDTFAEAVSGVAGEYEFDYLGKPVSFIATYGKVAIICARDTSIDSGTAIGWTYTPPAGGTAQNYWTDTEYVTSGTTVYLDTTFTGKAPYAVNGVDRSTDEGFWAVEGKETQADLATYGIAVTEGKAEVGDAIKVNLTFEESYYWTNLDVQAGGSTMKVVQTTGTSTTDVMSQNAVTDLVGNIQTVLEAI